MRRSELATMLLRERQVILARWVEKVQPPLGLEAMPQGELTSSIPYFLADIAAFLEEPVSTPEETTEFRSGEHGRQRFAVGFNLKEVIREYEALLEVIVEQIFLHRPKVELVAWQRLYSWLFSSIKEAVAAYTKARDREVDHQTNEYLAFLAHELRNPLTSVSLGLQLLQRRTADGDSDQVKVMRRSISNVLELIDDQLIELKLREGAAVELEEIPVEVILRRTAEYLAPNATSKGQTIEVSAEGDLTVRADLRLLRSILLNLLGNAIKFSKKGASLSLRARREDSDRILFSVRDECGGLDEGQAETMFRPYTQMGKDRSGHGLGLAIVKQASDAHEGRIRVRNFKGVGCEIIVSLPAEGPSGQPE